MSSRAPLCNLLLSAQRYCVQDMILVRTGASCRAFAAGQISKASSIRGNSTGIGTIGAARAVMVEYCFGSIDRSAILDEIGAESALQAFEHMVQIRLFEQRGESAYQQGLVGGFYHATIGQEAINSAAVAALGAENWWTTTYRCHALALLLGVSPAAAMAEFYGKKSGNAGGRGGSMHLFTDRLLGGHGIVGGGIPIAAGAAFSSQYLDQKMLSVCFIGDGAVAQGAFHESLNLASLWNLPLILVVENNQWGMGTAVDKAIAGRPIADRKAPSYDMEGFSVQGFDYLACWHLFKRIGERVRESSRPILIEAIVHRFRGHSISDPANYRTKEELERIVQQHDPIALLAADLKGKGWLTDQLESELYDRQRQIIKEAMAEAMAAPWPDIAELETEVYAP